ncbi:MAG: hypothetical protein ABI663_05425 [Chryseolinea sp.]
MKDKKQKPSVKSDQDVNSKRKRVALDAEGKPVKKDDSKETSSENFKPSSLKEDS